ncbi:elongin-A isoform X2 [Hevea brasiliensis]|nr:elongin-A isoform X2 [Hevea brasiliensis]
MLVVRTLKLQICKRILTPWETVHVSKRGKRCTLAKERKVREEEKKTSDLYLKRYRLFSISDRPLRKLRSIICLFIFGHISRRRGSTNMPERKRKAPTLVDLCVNVAISHVRYLGDVGETDLHLLDRILPHCTLDQLMHVEKSTGRDLSPVTDKLWKRFFERQFGEANTNLAIERMKRCKASFQWRDLYEAKLKVVAKEEDEAVARLRQSYKKEDAKKQSKQIRLCTKVPPSGSKRNFYGGSGPGYSLSHVKSNLMKKSKLDFLKSREVKNIAAMKKISVQRNNSASTLTKTGGFPGNSSASSSRQTESFDRRF